MILYMIYMVYDILSISVCKFICRVYILFGTSILVALLEVTWSC